MEIREVPLDYDDLCIRVVSLQRRAIVCRWVFPDCEDFDSASWVNKKWKSIIGYSPIVSKLLNGWFSVHFMNEKDVHKVTDCT